MQFQGWYIIFCFQGGDGTPRRDEDELDHKTVGDFQRAGEEGDRRDDSGGLRQQGDGREGLLQLWAAQGEDVHCQHVRRA